MDTGSIEKIFINWHFNGTIIIKTVNKRGRRQDLKRRSLDSARPFLLLYWVFWGCLVAVLNDGTQFHPWDCFLLHLPAFKRFFSIPYFWWQMEVVRGDGSPVRFPHGDEDWNSVPQNPHKSLTVALLPVVLMLGRQRQEGPWSWLLTQSSQ